MFPNRASDLYTGPPTAPPHREETRAVEIAGKAKTAPSYKGVGVGGVILNSGPEQPTGIFAGDRVAANSLHDAVETSVPRLQGYPADSSGSEAASRFASRNKQRRVM